MRNLEGDAEVPLLEKDYLEDDFKDGFQDKTDHLARPEDQYRPTLTSPAHTLTSLFDHRPRTKLRRLLLLLSPSFLRLSSKATPKHGVAALDGLRGLASFFVFNEHYIIFYMSRDSQHWINHVPFLRMWRYGKGAVYLFFIISGYVLSYKPLKQARARDYRNFQKTLSSSILRRGFRLYIPCLIASVIMAGLTIAGLYRWPQKVFERLHDWLFLQESPPPLDRSLSEYWQMYWDNVRFIFCSTFPFEIPLSEYDYTKWDPHVWTIPVEFRGSIALFTVLMGTSRMRTSWRLGSHMVMFYYLQATNRLYVSLFLLGPILAEIDLIRQTCQHSYPLIHSPPQSSMVLLFVAGFFMLTSTNELGADNYLPRILNGWVESPDWFLLATGASLAVWTAANSSALAPVFNNPSVQYLGNISYALYLVHGTVIVSPISCLEPCFE